MTTTMAALLLDRPTRAADQLSRRLDRQSKPLDLAAHGVPGLSRRIADAVAGVLDLPVSGVILGAWEKQQAIREACAQTSGIPGATASVVLAEHTLSSTHRPRVYLDVAGQQVHILDLELALILTIEAITVHVVEGRVTGCGPGTVASSAELRVARPGGRGVRLLHRELRRVKLPQHRSSVDREPRGVRP